MPDVIDLLEGLADTPPAHPRPPAELRDRVAGRRRRRHRRRSLAGLGVATAVVLAGVLVVVQRDEPSRVSVGPSTTATTAPSLEESRGGLTVTPSTGLRDGDTVTLALDPDNGGELAVTQCAAEVLEFEDDEEGDIGGLPTEWCGSTHYLRSPAGSPDLVVTVNQRQRAGRGTVDCAERPGRCLIMVSVLQHSLRPGAPTPAAPLTFDASEPLGTPTVRLVDADEPLSDGELVEVQVSGVAADASVSLVQCRGETGTEVVGMCDEARVAEAAADADGQAVVDVRVFQDIWPVGPDGMGLGWTTCEPCHLVLRTFPEVEASVAVELEPTGTPLHPALRIAEDAPYRPGQTVTLDGEGFQSGQEVGLMWCAGPDNTCGYQRMDDSAIADDDGRFSHRYGLPAPGSPSASCGATGQCAIAWDMSLEGTPPIIRVAVDMSG